MQVEQGAPLWLPLDGAEATLERVGGKGAALARLAAAGLPVPAGCQLTTAAYRRFVAFNDLQAVIAGALADVSTDDPAGLERAAATIRARFEAGTLPDELAAAIRQAYARLGDDQTAVAVRSSATAEDLPGLSFAGQQESYLNVRGEAALLEAVRRCWGSLWTARAIAYRQRMGVGQQAVTMGVVVQVMVPAEVAGVLFTANPTSGDRDELVINASFGLGEAIVAGRVTPDSYVLERDSLEPKNVVLGSKELQIVPAAGGQGTAEQAVPASRRAEQALALPLLRELAGLGLRVEALAGGVPQDVEWAVADGRCWLLQARPITSLPPSPLRDVRWEPPSPGSGWIRRQVVEHMPEPLSPLFEELYVREGLERSIDVVVDQLGMRSLIDDIMERPFFAVVNGYAYMRADVKTGWRFALALVRAYLVALPWFVRRGVAIWRDEGLPTYLAAVERWRRVDPTTASDETLLRGVRELAWADAHYWYPAAIAIGLAKVTDQLLDWFLGVAAPGRRLTSGLFLRGLPSKVLEAEAALEAIADQIRRSDELRSVVAASPAERLPERLASTAEGPSVLEALEAYLERYGHQIYSLDFAVPVQADDPRSVLASLKAMALGPKRDVQARQAELARERDWQVARTARALGPLRGRIFRRLLGWAYRFGPYREEALFYLGLAWRPLRSMALELGRRLTAAGSLERPDDVFYLESVELAEASLARAGGQARPDLQRLARERRALREARKRLHPPGAVPPSFRFRIGSFDLSSRLAQRENLGGGATLEGFAVSPGRVTAPASVILSPADFGQMAPGSILVCPTTTPAWTPLFAQARGLVTDIGGILAHGSIVAREYGIPAVMGTGTATQRIANGQQITVDGDLGTVTLDE
jgi:pyruvate,water dikinase